MNPRPYDGRHAEAVRELHCVRYNACLNVAEAGKWPSFHCRACRDFVPQSEEQERHDLDAIAALIGHHKGRVWTKRSAA